MIQRLALYLTLALVLGQLDQSASQWGFWAITALFMAYGWLNTQEGIELGLAQGIEIWTKLTEEQRVEITQLIKTIEKEHDE
jgi:hypothetical protein